MTKKTKGKNINPHTLLMKSPEDGDLDKRFSEYAVNPATQSAITIQKYGVSEDFQDTDINSLSKTLSEQITKTNENDLSSLEGMLTAQAYTLNAMFNNLTQKAVNNMSYDMSVAADFLKFGLRAQSQCRSTIEAISTVKNPPVMGYVKQANITQGPQQINNGTEQSNTPRAGEKQNSKNELLEKQDGNQLDTGTQSEAISDDSAMEAVGAVYRTKDQGREG